MICMEDFVSIFMSKEIEDIVKRLKEMCKRIRDRVHPDFVALSLEEENIYLEVNKVYARVMKGKNFYTALDDWKEKLPKLLLQLFAQLLL